MNSSLQANVTIDQKCAKVQLRQLIKSQGLSCLIFGKICQSAITATNQIEADVHADVLREGLDLVQFGSRVVEIGLFVHPDFQ